MPRNRENALDHVVAAGEAIGTLGKHLGQAISDHLSESKLQVIRMKPNAEVSPKFALALVNFVARRYFPRLASSRRARWHLLRIAANEYVRDLRGKRPTPTDR